jgi:hypothetical protein
MLGQLSNMSVIGPWVIEFTYERFLFHYFFNGSRELLKVFKFDLSLDSPLYNTAANDDLMLYYIATR